LEQPASPIVGIDARAAAEVRAGRGRVVRELLRALAAREDDRRYILYTRSVWSEGGLGERFRWRAIRARDPIWHVLAARAASRECGVFLSSNSYLTTLFLRVPAVTIVYDLTTFERSMRPNRRSAAIERLTLGPAVERSAALVAISQATREELVRRFPAAAGRAVVAPLGVTQALSTELDATEAAALPRGSFVLAVGTLEPRKNLPRLVEAFQMLPVDLQREHPLVVVGARGWQTGETLRALRALGERCTILGHVSDGALAELYRRCAVFCYPSLGEGFGLPVLEAMAEGAAVLTSNVSSLPEVGGDAVAYANPRDTAGIAEQLLALLRNPAQREDLAGRGRARARGFSWGDFAECTLKALDRAARTR
jgi:glycosyltransferase involved in cell wall biosynthesis